MRHLSAGDLLREAVKNGNTELEATMKEGKLVPLETTIALLQDAMAKSSETTFLIDGFPRALDQAHAFEKQARNLPTPVLPCGHACPAGCDALATSYENSSARPC